MRYGSPSIEEAYSTSSKKDALVLSGFLFFLKRPLVQQEPAKKSFYRLFPIQKSQDLLKDMRIILSTGSR